MIGIYLSGCGKPTKPGTHELRQICVAFIPSQLGARYIVALGIQGSISENGVKIREA